MKIRQWRKHEREHKLRETVTNVSLIFIQKILIFLSATRSATMCAVTAANQHSLLRAAVEYYRFQGGTAGLTTSCRVRNISSGSHSYGLRRPVS